MFGFAKVATPKRNHPVHGIECFGCNIDAVADNYCQDCSDRGECSQNAEEEYHAVLRELREARSERA